MPEPPQLCHTTIRKLSAVAGRRTNAGTTATLPHHHQKAARHGRMKNQCKNHRNSNTPPSESCLPWQNEEPTKEPPQLRDTTIRKLLAVDSKTMCSRRARRKSVSTAQSRDF
jgi:hypothetical protein